MSSRVASLDGLVAINAQSVREGYNRTLVEGFEQAMEPHQVVVLTPIMIHEHAAGALVDPHMRCRVTLAEHGGMNTPIHVILDVKMETWERLVPIDEAMERLETLKEKYGASEGVRADAGAEGSQGGGGQD